MERYCLIELCTDGLARLSSYEYGTQLWTRRVTRKDFYCRVCSFKKTKRTHAFAPLTNGYNRMHRICDTCVTRMAASAPARSSE